MGVSTRDRGSGAHRLQPPHNLTILPPHSSVYITKFSQSYVKLFLSSRNRLCSLITTPKQRCWSCGLVALERQHPIEEKCIRQPTGPCQCPENNRLLPSSRAHLPCQGIRHEEVESHFEIKGVNCLDTTILKKQPLVTPT